MRLIPVIAAAFSVFISCSLFAQGWIEYASQADFFTVNLPGEPTVGDITYETEYHVVLPGRVYSYVDGPNRYSVTVVNWAESDRMHAERVARCQANGGDGDLCVERSALDRRAAIAYATWEIMNRGAQVTHFVYYIADFVEGHHLQVTNSNGSRTYAAIKLHEDRLYILEATVTADSIPPLVFQQSLGFLDGEGRSIRYRSIYSNGFPAPPRSR